MKRPHVIPESTDNSDVAGGNSSNSSSVRLLSHPSAASIASSTESSAGDSASSNKESKPLTTQAPTGSSSIEIEVASSSATLPTTTSAANTAAPTASSSQQPKKSTLSMSNTGAIPKSISFDKTVVLNSRGHSKDESPVSSSSEVDPNSRELKCQADQDQGQGSVAQRQSKVDKSFFKSWKLPKIGRSHRGGGTTGGNQSHRTDFLSSNSDEQVPLPGDSILVPTRANEDEVTADDILAKYRSKPRNGSGELSTSNEVILSAPFATNAQGKIFPIFPPFYFLSEKPSKIVLFRFEFSEFF